MNKNAIKKFAIEARKKLIASVTDKAGMLGITPDHCNEAVTKGADFEVYQTAAGTEVTLNRKQCEQRRKLVGQIHARGFEAVIEEVAYTWFNRICAIRFMEVNDYMYPVRVRVLSSEKEGKNEPDVLTMAPDIDWNFTDEEREYIIEAKMNNQLDDLFRMLFIKQCNLLHEVLPGLFEETEDYTEMLLNISFTNEDDVVRMLVDRDKGIPEEDFNVNTLDEKGNPTGQVEIIGWLYQYYNTELKDDTFAKLKKNIKISKERIPAATQLFTPDWIVRYMVENSVGRIWIEHLRAVDPSVDEKKTAEKFGWKYYLPEAEQEESVNVKLAEIRATYKDLKPEDITCIDPCMGSGHILIAMFDVLMDIYESAGYDKREAAFEIVEHNIHGLDIDKRAYQLAYFAVMMKGRGYNRRFLRDGDRRVEPKVYAIIESGHTDPDGKKQYEFDSDTLDYFVDGDPSLKKDMNLLVDAMFDAREYGSILKIPTVDFNRLFKRFDEIEEEISLFKQSVMDTLYPIVSLSYMLAKKYDAVVTNPPYMGASGMDANLSKYVKENYPESKSDLFAVFINKWNSMVKSYRFNCMVTMQSWMFLSSFEKMRISILNTKDIIDLMHMENMVMGIAFGTAVTTFRNSHIQGYKGIYNQIKLCDIENNKPKYFPIMENRYSKVSADSFSKIPGSPVAYWASEAVLNAFGKGKSIGQLGCVRNGMKTGDNDLFLRLWWEVPFCKMNTKVENYDNSLKSNDKWFPYNKGGEFRKWYGNNEWVVNWENQGREVIGMAKIEGRNVQDYPNNMKFLPAVTWSLVTSGKPSFRYKQNHISDIAGMSLYASRSTVIDTIGLLNTKVADSILKIIAPTVNFQSGDIARIPYIQPKETIDDTVEVCIELSKFDWDSFEISWDFKTHPFLQMNKNTVDADGSVVTRISDSFGLWKAYTDIAFEKLKHNEEELNRIFIDIYGLQDELTPEEDDKDVTIRKADLGRDIRSFISYAVGCMFGRYSLDEEGLILAGQPLESHFYMATAPVAGTGVSGNPGPYLPTGEYYYKDENGEVKKCSFNPDADNIIPITDEEYFSDDIVSRFVEFVKTVYGEETLEENLKFIADALGNKGNTSREVIRNYFLKDFYADHLKVYQKRPIYWLFDSGKQNGFKALIYMHRYDADTVGRVRTDYLHKAQKYVETAMQSAQYTIDNSTSASEKSKATKAVTKYTKQLAEMKIYDEAIAHVANQRIEIDLDDGVKVNYAKFQGVEVAQEGKKALKVDLLARI